MSENILLASVVGAVLLVSIIGLYMVTNTGQITGMGSSADTDLNFEILATYSVELDLPLQTITVSADPVLYPTIPFFNTKNLGSPGVLVAGGSSIGISADGTDPMALDVTLTPNPFGAATAVEITSILPAVGPGCNNMATFTEVVGTATAIDNTGALNSNAVMNIEERDTPNVKGVATQKVTVTAKANQPC